MPIFKMRSLVKNPSMTVKLTSMAFAIYLLFALIVTPILAKMNLSEEVVFFQRSSNLARSGAIGFLKNKDITGACEHLAQSYRDQLLSFYVVQANKNLFCSEPKEALADINLEYHEFGKLIRSPDLDYSFQSDQVESFVVTTGSINDSNAKLGQYLKALSSRLLLAPALIFLLFIFIFSLASIPWKNLTARLRNQVPSSKKGFLDKLARSRESVLVQAATEAFYLENQTLREKIKFIADDFSTALRKDMQDQGASFPYFFQGSILRFDLNDYTKLYFETDKPFISRLIRTIAVQVDEIVNRYGGAHYSFGGDEFLQVFKNSEHTVILALACVRDIFDILPSLELEPQVREKIKFKASISYDSKNLFAELPQCDTLTSTALILTNRYFAAVDEKNVNTVLTGAKELPSASRIATFETAKAFHLKNIQGEHLISRVSGFLRIQDVLKSKNFDLLPFFRSDKDLVEIFHFLSAGDCAIESKMKIAADLKSFQVSICSQDLVRAWLATVKSLDSTWTQNERLLSSVIMAAKNLIPRTQWSGLMTEALSELKVNSDGRANSDIIEVLSTKISQEQFDEVEERLLAPTSGFSCRAQGNLIIAKTSHALTEQSVRDIQALLTSKDSQKIATGIFCASRVIQKYRIENPVVLSQYLEFDEFIEIIAKHSQHPDPIVRSRATVETNALSLQEF